MIKKYSIGFLASLILTCGSFWLVTYHIVNGTQLVVLLASLACIQIVVQLYYFLHLADGDHPRLRLLSIVFTLLIILMIVGGSLWIMQHLNDNMMHMSPGQKDGYMNMQKNGGF